MRTLLLLLISVAVALPATESNPRVTRLMETFTTSASAAEEAYQQAIQQAEAARAAALTTARDRTITGLKRLVNNRSGVAEQAEVYTQVLRLNREDEDAVRFFTAIGTLEQVLAGLEPAVETDLLGNVVGSGQVSRAPISGLPDPILHVSFDADPRTIQTPSGILQGVIHGRGIEPAEGIRGRGIRLDGSTYLSFPVKDHLPAGRSDRTISVWYRVMEGSPSRMALVSYGQPRPRQWICMDIRSMNHNFSGYDMDRNGPSVEVGRWHNMVITYSGDNSQFGMFVDGIRVATAQGVLASDATNLYIGSQNLSQYPRRPFHGDLDEVTIWNEALTAEQVKALYDSMKP